MSGSGNAFVGIGTWNSFLTSREEVAVALAVVGRSGSLEPVVVSKRCEGLITEASQVVRLPTECTSCIKLIAVSSVKTDTSKARGCKPGCTCR